MRILVVEDNLPIRECMVDFLGLEGHEVEEADGGHSAIQLIERCEAPFDLVITDMRLPGANGLEVCKVVQKHAPRCKLILMSGSMDDDNLRELARRQAVEVLSKPFPMSALVDRVQDMSVALQFGHRLNCKAGDKPNPSPYGEVP